LLFLAVLENVNKKRDAQSDDLPLGRSHTFSGICMETFVWYPQKWSQQSDGFAGRGGLHTGYIVR
jgi:hypothetical protein